MPVSSMVGEMTREVRRKPSVFCAMGTEAPGTRAAVPGDPALPGLALLNYPEQLLAVLTPLLRSRLGSRIELTHDRLFVHRYIPGKRCIVKLEVKMRPAPGMPGKRHFFFAKFYTAGHGARVYKNCQRLWHGRAADNSYKHALHDRLCRTSQKSNGAYPASQAQGASSLPISQCSASRECSGERTDGRASARCGFPNGYAIAGSTPLEAAPDN